MNSTNATNAIKVLHVIDSGGLYGAETMLLNLVTEQRQQGMDPIIASIGDPWCGEKPLETEALRRGLPVEPFRMLPGPNFAGAMKILRFARKEGVEILHSHGYKGNILFGLMPKNFRRIRMVTTLHGWTWTGGWNRMRFYECLDRLSLCCIDRVVGVNKAMRSKVKLNNFHVVNNGIAPLDKTLGSGVSLDPQILAFCRSGHTIGAIGRLSPEKGFDILLDAVYAVAKTQPEVRLVILGEGAERAALEAQIKKLGLEDRVLMPGYVGNARDYLPFFKMFVISSLTEGLPMVLLEAMRAGTPVISTAVGGIADALENGKAGTLVKGGDVNGLSEAILSVYRAPDVAAQKSHAAKEKVLLKYSAARMAQAYSDLYSELLDRS